ncbi:MAG TPA: hypothetical protein VFJ04_06685 [Rhodanobacteraceae bacterium]|nr:hypothetical protein [Rhodanobacteraceae bacterium]
MSRFTVALSGLAETDAARFRAVLDKAPALGWALTDDNDADLLVVDIDSVWGHMDWLRATAGGQHVAVYSEHRDVRDCDWLLTKPLQTPALEGMLRELAQKMPERAAAPVVAPAAAPVAAPKPQPSPDAAPLPATVGACLLADRFEHAMVIENGAGVTLQLDPERGGYYGPLTLKSVQPLLDLPSARARPLDIVALAKARQAPALPMTRLLWFAALCATPGRLGSALDPQARYRLTRWPKIEREFPRHFRIATTMMKQAGTLEEVAAAANAPVGDVADFINAYCLAGHVAAETASGEPAAEAGPGMLSRLRRPFARGGTETA